MARLVQEILKGTRFTFTPDATGDCIGCKAEASIISLQSQFESCSREPVTLSCHIDEQCMICLCFHAVSGCMSLFECTSSVITSNNECHFSSTKRTAYRCPYPLIQQSPGSKPVEIQSIDGGFMKQKRVCLTLSESDGKKLEEIADELKQNKTSAMRLLILSWKGSQTEELKQQVTRLTNLVILLTSILSGFIKDFRGNDIFYWIKNEADKNLKAYKESGKLSM
jgi:hypothetical protein